MNSAMGSSRKILIPFAALILCAIMLAPFFRGLFFEPEMGIHHYAVAMLAIAFGIVMGWVWKESPRQSHAIVTSPYFIAVGMLMVLYGVSFFFAVNAREALFEWLRQVDVLIVFVIVYILAWAWRGESTEQGEGSTEKGGSIEQGGPASERSGISKSFVEIAMIAIVVTGTALAVIGVLASQGILTLGGAMLTDRLCSTLQYPNTLGSYLTVTFLLTLHLAAIERRLPWSALYAGAGLIMMLGILGSQSRGLMLVLPLIFFVFIMGQRERLQATALFFLIFAFALALYSNTVGPGSHAQSLANMRAFGITVGGMVAVAVVWIGMRMLGQRRHQLRSVSRSWWIAAVLIGVIVVGGASWTVIQKGNIMTSATSSGVVTRMSEADDNANTNANVASAGGALPSESALPSSAPSAEGAFARLKAMDASDSNIRERFVFYGDAMKMALDRPLLGWGGGGWKSAYRAYQSFLYHTTETHNHFAQVWVETGTLGLIAFLLPFFAIPVGFVGLWKKRQDDPEVAQAWTLGVAALGIGIHAFMDFNLSLSSVMILLWTILALLAAIEMRLGVGLASIWSEAPAQKGKSDLSNRSTARPSRRDPLDRPAAIRGIAVTLVLLAIPLAGFTYMVRSADAKMTEYSVAVQNGDADGAMAALERAAKSDPWRADIPANQASMYMGSIGGNNDPQIQQHLATLSLQSAQKAVKLDSYNAKWHFLLAQAYMIVGQYESTMAEANQGLTLQPWVVTSYEDLANQYVNVAMKQKVQGATSSPSPALALLAGSAKSKERIDPLARVLDLLHEVPEKKAGLPENLKSLWRHPPDMVVTPRLAFYAGEAAAMQGDWKMARSQLETAMNGADGQLQPLVKAWLGTVKGKLGDSSGERLIQEAKQASPVVEQEVQRIQRLGI